MNPSRDMIAFAHGNIRAVIDSFDIRIKSGLNTDAEDLRQWRTYLDWAADALQGMDTRPKTVNAATEEPEYAVELEIADRAVHELKAQNPGA